MSEFAIAAEPPSLAVRRLQAITAIAGIAPGGETGR